MRILMLTDLYPPIIGGVEQHVRNLSAELVARGHSVAVATLWHSGLAEYEEQGGVRIYRMRGTMARVERLFSDGGRRYAPPFPDPEVTIALRKIVSKERPQIVHAHNWLLHSYLPIKAFSRARLVVTLHDYSLICPKKNLMHNGQLCAEPSLSKCIGCASQHYGRAIGVPTVIAHKLTGVPERKMVDMFMPVSSAVAEGNRLPGSGLPYQVVPNFVPDNIADTAGDAEHWLKQLPGGDFMLFVGALGKHKGVEVLLEAYKDMQEAPPLVMIGADWPDTPKEFPANTHVLRNWPHHAVMQAWKRSMLAIVPSIWPEPCPTVAMEAMSCGKAVIAARSGGLPDIVSHEESGIVVAANDPTALREAMLRLVADPALRERMGAAGRIRLSHFQASNVISRIESVYTQLLRQKKAPIAAMQAAER